MIRLIPTALLVLFVVGCGSLGVLRVKSGQTADDVRAAMGAPARIWSDTGGGESWEYSYPPRGQTAYMVRLDASKRVTRVDQVLTQENLYSVRAGMTQEDVERKLGRPSDKRPDRRGAGEEWMWRWVDVYDMCFYAYFSPDGIVQSTGTKVESAGEFMQDC